jgi:Receptor family ligand binding region
MHQVFHINHLAIININDSYGNAFVEGLRKAAEIHAPDMKFQQVPLDDGDASIKAAVAAVQKSQYRYIFLLVFTNEVHDAIMTEAYAQGVAGSGVHNWIAGDSFQGTLDGRTFPKGSPLHLSYRGAGLLEVTGGVKGMPLYDAFVDHYRRLHNPADLETLGGLTPESESPLYDPEIFFNGDHPSFAKELSSGYAALAYEAAVALGVAACDATLGGTHMKFSGQEHYDAFKAVNLTGFSGPLVIDPDTGTRDPVSAAFKTTNYQEQFETDPDTGEEVVRFVPVTTHIFQQGKWNQTDDYIFNDGTSNVPADLPPSETAANDSGVTLALIIVIPIVVVAILGVVMFLFYENKRKKNDAVWVVNKEDIKFDDPPTIIGRGTFGLVLLGEYRGTQVAVKRVIPPKAFSDENGSSGMKSGMASGMKPGMTSGMRGSTSGTGIVPGSNGGKRGESSWAGMSMLGSVVHSASANQTKKRPQGKSAQWKQMKAEFLEEMRYLSKLRHPCITTVRRKKFCCDRQQLVFSHSSPIAIGYGGRHTGRTNAYYGIYGSWFAL